MLTSNLLLIVLAVKHQRCSQCLIAYERLTRATN
nr:hypothetical protein RKYZRHPG_RKYZRHPG_CDS_0009 [uncultured phage]